MPSETDLHADGSAPAADIPTDLITLQQLTRKFDFLPRDAVRRAVISGLVRHWQLGGPKTAYWVSEAEMNDWVRDFAVPKRGAGHWADKPANGVPVTRRPC